MEWVLHRTNSFDRADQGIAAGCDRLELDLWHKGGRFRISHDPSLGPLVIGPNGVGVPSRARFLGWVAPLRVVGRFLTLPELLRMRPSLPPLLLDLKGRWTPAGIDALAERLGSRRGDAVCGTF